MFEEDKVFAKAVAGSKMFQRIGLFIGITAVVFALFLAMGWLKL